MKFARWQIGKGDRISITDDTWLVTGERILGIVDPNVTKVSELIDRNNSSWNLTTLRMLFDHNTVMKILQTPIRWFEGEICYVAFLQIGGLFC